MFYSKNVDYEIMRESFLYYNIKKSMQSQTAQIIMNLISDDNIFLMTLESMLSLLKQ